MDFELKSLTLHQTASTVADALLLRAACPLFSRPATAAPAFRRPIAIARLSRSRFTSMKSCAPCESNCRSA